LTIGFKFHADYVLASNMILCAGELKVTVCGYMAR